MRCRCYAIIIVLRSLHLNVKQAVKLFNASLQEQAHVHVMRNGGDVRKIRSHDRRKKTYCQISHVHLVVGFVISNPMKEKGILALHINNERLIHYFRPRSNSFVRWFYSTEEIGARANIRS